MRHDMNKVFHEKPRRGHNSSFREVRHSKDFNQIPPDELPYKESMNFRYKYFRQTKSTNIHNGPILKFLQKSVGLPWDVIYSKICYMCKNDKSDFTIEDFLNREIYINDINIGADGGVYVNVAYSSSAFRLDKSNSFYVHPLTKILCKGDKKKYKRYVPPITAYYYGNDILRKEDGIWYIYLFKKYTPEFYQRVDSFGELRTHLKHVFCMYYSSYCISTDKSYAYNKKQLTRAQLKFHNLVNDYVQK